MKTDWFKDWFESDEYLKVYSHRNLEDAKRFTATLFNKINLKKNSVVLDAACGNGRYSVLFSELNYNVIAFDLSMNLLSEAKKQSSANGRKILFFRADIRNLCFKIKFDLILLAFTSFGYFETDEDNFKFIRSSFDFLKPGGYFVLDFLNEAYLKKNLVPHSEKIIDGLSIKEERKIETGTVVKKIIIAGENTKKVYFEKVRLYSKDFVVKQMELIGFKIVDIFGNYDGSRFEPETSERLIIIGRK